MSLFLESNIYFSQPLISQSRITVESNFLNPNVKFRKNIIRQKYDVCIVLVIHQGRDMVNWYVKNIQRFCGQNKILCVIHYNNNEFIDEHELPNNFWIARKRLKTVKFTQMIFMAFLQAIYFAHQNFSFTNYLLLSSSSGLFKSLPDMTKPMVAQNSHEGKFLNKDVEERTIHLNPINGKYIGNIDNYLRRTKSKRLDVYKKVDKDINFIKNFKKRKFKYFKVNQITGNVFPKPVGRLLLLDFYNKFQNIVGDYQSDEVYFSTYAYNWAITHNLTVQDSFTIINWHDDIKINMNDIEHLNTLYEINGYATYRLSNDVLSEMRKYLI